MRMNSIQNWSAVKVAVPSEVQQQFHLEEMFVLMDQGKEISLYSVSMFVMTKKPLGDSYQTALRALQLSKPTQPAQPTSPANFWQTSLDVT